MNTTKLLAVVKTHPRETITPAITMTLSLVPYIRFVPKSIELRTYFLDIISNCAGITSIVWAEVGDEASSDMVDTMLEQAFQLFRLRYNDSIYPDESSILEPGVKLKQYCDNIFTKEQIPSPQLVKALLTDFQNEVINGDVLVEHTALGLATLIQTGSV